MHVQFVPITKNSKTGRISVTSTEAKSCPKACPFRDGKGCYYFSGYHTSMNNKHLENKTRGGTWDDMCESVSTTVKPGAIWRHNIGGDLPHYEEVIDFPKTKKLVDANTGKEGFTFTHHDMDIPGNRMVVKYCNDNGFTVNLSANGLRHADTLSDLGIAPIAVALPSDFANKVFYTPNGRKGVICPAIQKDNVTCKTCGLCAKSDRKVIIGFPAHGSGAKKVDEVLAGIESDYQAEDRRSKPQRDPKTGRFVKGNTQYADQQRADNGQFQKFDFTDC